MWPLSESFEKWRIALVLFSLLWNWPWSQGSCVWPGHPLHWLFSDANVDTAHFAGSFESWFSQIWSKLTSINNLQVANGQALWLLASTARHPENSLTFHITFQSIYCSIHRNSNTKQNHTKQSHFRAFTTGYVLKIENNLPWINNQTNYLTKPKSMFNNLFHCFS